MARQATTTPVFRGTTVEALRLEMQLWAQRVAEALDAIQGLRGTPKMHNALDMGGKRITNVGSPQSDDEVELKGHSLRASTIGGDYDAGGKQIVNIRRAVLDTEVVRKDQLDDVKSSATLNYVTLGTVQTITALKTFTAGISLGDETISVYDEATFTVTGTGFVANPTGTARYIKIGNIVVVFIPQLTGTSNTTTFTLTGIPAAIQASRTIGNFPIRYTDNSVASTTPGLLVIPSGGTWNLYTNWNAAGWTASNTKTLEPVCCCYHVL